MLFTSRKEKPKLSELTHKIKALGGIVPKRPRLLLGRNLTGYIATLESTLGGLSSGASATVTPPKAPAPTAEPVKATQSAATDTLESLIAQHSALEARIESLQPKASTLAKISTNPKASTPPAKASAVIASSNRANQKPQPTAAATVSQRQASEIRKASGKSLSDIAVATYGQPTVDAWAKSSGPDGLENDIMRRLWFDNLATHVPGFNVPYFQAVHGSPKPVWGTSRFEHKTKLDKLTLAISA